MGCIQEGIGVEFLFMEEVMNPIDNKPIAIMLIGHQYTGKSTFLSRMSDVSHSDKYFNLDAYLHEEARNRGISYQEAFNKYVKEADAKLQSDYRRWIDEKQNIVIDRTNTTVKSRMRVARPLLKAGYEIWAFIFPNLSDDEIKRRIAMRPDQPIPFDVVASFRDKMEPLSEEELRIYDRVDVLTSFGKPLAE